MSSQIIGSLILNIIFCGFKFDNSTINRAMYPNVVGASDHGPKNIKKTVDI
jgi:hypothetical protein